jgi:Ca-activated chloride channel family protein
MGRLILLITAVGLASISQAEEDANANVTEQLSARVAVQQGNQQLIEGNAPAALEAYAHAHDLRPDALEIPFVQGLGHFALKEYDEAKTAFEKAATSKDHALADDALYSVGTCYHAEALDKPDEPQAAIEKLENALQRYQSVLASQPQHEAARDATVKAASLRRQIKQMLQQQEQEKSECDNPKEGEEGEEEKKESESSQKNDEKQQEQQQQSDQSEQQEQSDSAEQQQGEQQESEQQQAEGEEQQQMSEAQQQEDASREQAQRRLREMMQDMRERQKQRRSQPQPVRSTPVDKDW